jgi:uncharacterized protein (TIGR02996 family)
MNLAELESNPDFLSMMNAVRLNPDCIYTKLILADWLEEKGCREWAEFIRESDDTVRMYHHTTSGRYGSNVSQSLIEYTGWMLVWFRKGVVVDFVCQSGSFISSYKRMLTFSTGKCFVIDKRSTMWGLDIPARYCLWGEGVGDAMWAIHPEVFPYLLNYRFVKGTHARNDYVEFYRDYDSTDEAIRAKDNAYYYWALDKMSIPLPVEIPPYPRGTKKR